MYPKIAFVRIMNEEALAMARSMVAEEAAAAPGELPQNHLVKNLKDKQKAFRWVIAFLYLSQMFLLWSLWSQRI